MEERILLTTIKQQKDKIPSTKFNKKYARPI